MNTGFQQGLERTTLLANPSKAYHDHYFIWRRPIGDPMWCAQPAPPRLLATGRPPRQHAVVPSILKAIELTQHHGTPGLALLQGALDAMAAAVILIDDNCCVVGMTRAAEAHVAAQTAVMVRDRVLRAVDRPSDARLAAGLARALAAPGYAMTGQLWLASTAGPALGLVAEIYSLPLPEWDLGPAPCLLVVLRAIDTSAGDSGTLRQAFDLSAAEAEVALLVAQGLTRDEIAARRGVSSQTVTSQLKAIYRKAGVPGQAQLAALVARMAGR